MTTIQEIEKAIQKLPPQDLKEFRDWFDAFEANQWDSQFELDVNSGKLDNFAEQAISEFDNGKCSKL